MSKTARRCKKRCGLENLKLPLEYATLRYAITAAKRLGLSKKKPREKESQKELMNAGGVPNTFKSNDLKQKTVGHDALVATAVTVATAEKVEKAIIIP